jgi:hypothetical protein
MIIIKTVYIAPTNTKGSRIKAALLDSAAGYEGYRYYPTGTNIRPLTATIGYPHELSGLAIYVQAAAYLLKKHKLWQECLDNGIYFRPNGDFINSDRVTPVPTKRGYDFIIPGKYTITRVEP